MQAPDFSLPDQQSRMRKLSQFRGKWTVLYFYPKDDTPGCTKEACNFRDSSDSFRKLGVTVVGISKDSTESHKKFADKYFLNFPLLSDESKETIKAYGAWGQKQVMGKTFEGVIRSTVVINPQGEIVKRYDKVNPLTHTEEILRDLKTLM